MQTTDSRAGSAPTAEIEPGTSVNDPEVLADTADRSECPSGGKRALLVHLPHYFLGRVLAAAIGAISFPLYTRAFSVSEYGQINLALKIILLATVFSKCGVQNAVMRFYEEHAVSSSSDRLRGYFSTAIFGSALIALAVTLSFTIGVALAPVSLVAPWLRDLLFVAAGLVFVRALHSVALSFYRMEGRTRSYNFLDVGTKALSLTLVAALLLNPHLGARAFFMGILTAEAVVIGIFLLFLARRRLLSPGHFNLELFRTLLAFGFPLIAYELASILLDSADRFLIQHHLGVEQLGLYSAAYNVSAYIQEFFVTPLSMALSPMFLKLWVTDGEQSTRKFVSTTMHYFILAGLCIVAGTVATGKDILTILASQKYVSAHPLMPVIVLGLLVYALHIFLNTALYIHKRSATSAFIVVVACLTNIALNIALLPLLGIQGAAVATLISYVVQIALIARVALPLLPLEFKPASCAKAALIAAIAGALALPVETGTPAWNFLVKGTLAVAVYVTLLCCVDRDSRGLLSMAACRIRHRATGNPV
jgi:O-antigen/teichoic acid export membrane protein